MMQPILVRASDLGAGQPTAGMTRREAFSDSGLWFGAVTTEPGAVSGWHHHGDHDTYACCVRGALGIESGPDGSHVIEAQPGDFVHIPARIVHRESNPSGELQLVIVRAGRQRAGRGERGRT